MRARSLPLTLLCSVSLVAQQAGARAQVCVPVVAQQVMGHTPFSAEVREHNKQQRQVTAEVATRSRHYLLLLDQSGSSRPDVEMYRYIVHRLATELPSYERDDIAVAAFQEQAGIVVPFTHKKEEVEAVLPQLGGQHHTALMDALFLASITAGKRAAQYGAMSDIILVTDADDNASRRKLKEVKQQVATSGVRMSPLIVAGAYQSPGTRRFDLDDISAATGGDMILLTEPTYLQTATTLLIEELRDAHSVCFETAHSPDGQHEIKVKAAKGWRIRYPKKVRELQLPVAATRQASMR